VPGRGRPVLGELHKSFVDFAQITRHPVETKGDSYADPWGREKTVGEPMDAHLAEYATLPDVDDTTALLRWFVGAFSLAQRVPYGVGWGLSVPASKRGDRIGVNLGSIQAIYAEYFDDGWWCFVAVPNTNAVRSTIAESKRSLIIGPGSTTVAGADHGVVVGRPTAVATFLRDPSVFAACAELHQRFLHRKLPKPDRANHEVAEFVLAECVDALRDRFGAERHAGIPYVFRAENVGAAPEEGLRRDLAIALQSRGIVALAPDERDLDWDLGWADDQTWTLVNTVDLTRADEELQLRQALGTTLRQYQLYLDRPPRLAVLTNRTPTDDTWTALFADYGVHLFDQPDLLVDTVIALS
jgi:hypothetical protein